jgi:hypothetical protein
MAVIGVLAGIVTTSVSGTGETSNVAQARTDASTAQSAAATFFTDQDETAVLSTKSVRVTARIAHTIDLATAAVSYDDVDAVAAATAAADAASAAADAAEFAAADATAAKDAALVAALVAIGLDLSDTDTIAAASAAASAASIAAAAANTAATAASAAASAAVVVATDARAEGISDAALAAAAAAADAAADATATTATQTLAAAAAARLAADLADPSDEAVAADAAADAAEASAAAATSAASAATLAADAAAAVAADAVPVTQEQSSRWPEVFITENLNSSATPLACVASKYCEEFPTTGLNTDGVVIRVIVVDKDGKAVNRATLLGDYTAVNFTTMKDQGYLETVPDSSSQVAEIVVEGAEVSTTVKAHNYLWLFRKSTTAGGGAEDDARTVSVFKLANAKVTEEAAGDTVTLSYAQIF